MSVAGVNASAFVERGLYRGCGAVWCCVAGVNASAFVERREEDAQSYETVMCSWG